MEELDVDNPYKWLEKSPRLAQILRVYPSGRGYTTSTLATNNPVDQDPGKRVYSIFQQLFRILIDILHFFFDSNVDIPRT